MPWSNQNGGSNGGGGPWGGGGDNGGNNGGGNNGGPWGQGPRKGGGGGNNNPPDLEELIRKGQDRLKQVLPGGGGSGGAGGAPNKAMFAFGGIALVGLWLFQSIYTVQPDELGVELLFGKPKTEVSEPGLHFYIWPIEKVEVANIREQLINVGDARNQTSNTGLMLSGDQNIVQVEFSVAYQVSSPKDYLFNVAVPDDMIRQISESAMREVVGRRPAQDIYRDDRQGIAENVREILQVTLDQYGAGINVNAVSIEDAAPPREVADAFEEVQRAEQDEDRFVEEANQYSNQQLGRARGEGARILEAASAYRTRVVEEATGEAQRFIAIYDEYIQAPDVTRQRLYLETLEGVLASTNKVIVEQGQDGSGVVPYLPLPEINNRRTTTTNAGGTN